MSRGAPAIVAAGALALILAGNVPVHAVGTTSQASARAGADSVALFATRDGGFQAVSGVSGSQPQDTKSIDIGGTSVATAINPRGGKDGLLCTNGTRIKTVQDLRTTPQVGGADIDATAYSGEGAADRAFGCDGLAMHGTFALAGGGSQGLLQLVRTQGSWKIDQRVRSRGRNDAGNRHAHGWIDIRDSLTKSTTFTGVAIAPQARNGQFLAVTVDRIKGTLVVLTGVGTSKPRAVGVLGSAALKHAAGGYGTGGVAFLPSSRDRALIATRTGFAVLDLHHPDAPQLRVKTRVGDGSVAPAGLSVSSDGDHVAVAAGAKIYAYRHVLAAVKQHKPFKRQTSFRLGDLGSERVSDVAYTDTDTLVVLHGDDLVATDWSLTLVKKVPRGRDVVRGSSTTTRPDVSGSLSVWPGA
jgi:hypothetical protein